MTQQKIAMHKSAQLGNFLVHTCEQVLHKGGHFTGLYSTCLHVWTRKFPTCALPSFSLWDIMNYLLYLCIHSLLRLHWMEIGITYFSTFNRPIHNVWNGYAYVCTEQAQMPKSTLVQLTPYIIQYCTGGHRKLETRPMTVLRTFNINICINKGIQQVYYNN